ncbi:MAG: MerR family transcriptional regulator, partial [Clostridia bacterium]|nr:MerR family transcriptional regulator [Clostridia bacterium]
MSSEIKKKDHYTIGDISKLYGIGADSLRYYEEKGLITPARTAAGYRIYKDTDIWRLNVIKELRGLDISVENIKKYLDSGSVSSTIQIFREELAATERQIEELKQRKEKLQDVLDGILQTEGIVFEKITEKHFDARHAYSVKRRYSTDEEMDKIMKTLSERYSDGIIGNHHIASVLTPMYDSSDLYEAALLLNDNGPDVIPAGDYLSVFYSGKWNSRHYAKLLMEYAQEHKLRLDTTFIDLVWIDIHTS